MNTARWNRLVARILVFGALCTAAGCGYHRLDWNTHAYRVREGDTLYAIAWRYRLDYKELARWNDIGPPYLIHPGQKLVLVDPQYLPERYRQASRPDKPAPATTGLNPPPSSPLPARPAGPPPERFLWPTEGKVVRTFDGSKNGSQGIDIAGREGQPVTAAAAGKVVYSGSGLVGYGKLVIVKHNDDYLSAYAHNRRLHVEEDEQVESGQKIAEMGVAENNTPRLHFEIRRQGRPVDPLKYLPER